MQLYVLGGLLLGLPAIAVVLVFWGSPMMIPALASLFVVMLPFLAGGYLMWKSKSKVKID